MNKRELIRRGIVECERRRRRHNLPSGINCKRSKIIRLVANAFEEAIANIQNRLSIFKTIIDMMPCFFLGVAKTTKPRGRVDMRLSQFQPFQSRESTVKILKFEQHRRRVLTRSGKRIINIMEKAFKRKLPINKMLNRSHIGHIVTRKPRFVNTGFESVFKKMMNIS